MFYLESLSEEILQNVEIFPLNVDISVEVESHGVVIVECWTHANEVDEADCLLLKLNEMDYVGDNQGLSPRHIVKSFEILNLVWGIILILADVENVEQNNENHNEEKKLCFQLHPISERMLASGKISSKF